jgi:DNA-binding MarR family transcriptional regulator
VLDFMRLLWALDHGLQVTSKRMAATRGVTGSQRLVVRVVGRLPGISVGEVAALLHLHKSTLTGVIVRLHRRGLLVSRRDSEDARRIRLVLTPAGRCLTRPWPGTIEMAVTRWLKRLPPRDRVAARRALRTLAAALGKEAPR